MVYTDFAINMCRLSGYDSEGNVINVCINVQKYPSVYLEQKR